MTKSGKRMRRDFDQARGAAERASRAQQAAEDFIRQLEAKDERLREDAIARLERIKIELRGTTAERGDAAALIDQWLNALSGKAA